MQCRYNNNNNNNTYNLMCGTFIYIIVIAVYRGIDVRRFRYYSDYDLRYLLSDHYITLSLRTSFGSIAHTFRVCGICRSSKSIFWRTKPLTVLVSHEKTSFVTYRLKFHVANFFQVFSAAFKIIWWPIN